MHYPLNEYFKLFSDCSVVSGYRNSILLDFTRPNMTNFVPCELQLFIDRCENKSLGEVLSNHNDSDNQIIFEYLDFMIKNEFGFFISKTLKDNFPAINTKLIKSPEIIDNAILEVDPENLDYLKSIYLLLEKCLVSSLEIRVKSLSKSHLENIINIFSYSMIQSIKIYLYSIPKATNLEDLNKLVCKNTRIKKLIAFGGDNSRISEDKVVEISAKNFNEHQIVRANIINLSYHLESQNVCTYRYKKLYIEFNGDIKNYPNSEKIIGNIQKDKLENLIETLSAEAVENYDWYVTKDKINVCKDCEFRTVCFTNNLPVKNKLGSYLLETECTYNPYISKTKGEEGYHTLEECGVISNENCFSVDHEKIAKINKELWGEEEN